MKKYKLLYDINRVSWLTKKFTKKEFDEYIKESEIRLSRKNTVAKIHDFIEHNEISADSLKIFNKILGDVSILDKIVFVNNTQCRNNNIIYCCGFSDIYSADLNNTEDFIDTCMYEYKYFDYSEYVERLNHLKNNYEFIFIKLTSDSEYINILTDLKNNIDAIFKEYEEGGINYGIKRI